MNRTRVRARRRAALVALATTVALGLAGCSSDDEPKKDKDTSTGILKVSDMPFDDVTTNALPRPPVLSQLGTSCLGLEQGDLYDAGWEVRARQFYDSYEWTVISAVFTPPSGSTAKEGLDQVKSEVESCTPKEKGVRIEPVDLGGSTYAYQVTTPQGAFNAARAYKVLPNDTLAQVSVMKLPKGEDAAGVLKELVADLE